MRGFLKESWGMIWRFFGIIFFSFEPFVGEVLGFWNDINGLV